jgi:serine/threonine protein kinase/predicted ATPase
VRFGRNGGPSQDMDEQPQRIGPYRLFEVLGHGGMGVVYRAEHVKTGSRVALKTVKAASERLLAGIRREVHALTLLRHPGIVRILEVGLDETLPWYAMELLEGRTLQTFRATLPEPATLVSRPDLAAWSTTTPDSEPSHAASRPWPAAAAGSALKPILTLLRRLCSPLGYLHGEGVVHGDLKPENVLVDARGLPVLVDFGLMSRFSAEVSRESLAAMAGGGGTLAYMAPEQLMGFPVDARADLYALGCIAYELVTGRVPFPGPSPAETIRGHVEGAALAPSELVPGLPPEVDELVLRLLAKDPRDRYGHADRVAAALGALGADEWPPAGLPPTRTFLYRPGFQGRREILGELERALGRLESGIGGLVLVGGESGAGKTRLAMELARMAKRRGLRVLSGECTPEDGAAASGSGGGPLHPLSRPLQAVADRCLEAGPAEAERLLGPRVRVLARYHSALADLPGLQRHPEPKELPPEAARLRLYTALCDTFAAFAGARPAQGAAILLLLDDLQWADELTLGFLDYLLRERRLEKVRLLVLGTYRTEEAGDELRRLAMVPRALHQRLEGLEEADVDGMVADMLALREPPWWLGAYLGQVSDGNPFFVAEMLRAAVGERLLERDAAGRWKVLGMDWEQAIESGSERLVMPRSVRGLVERRLDDLRPHERAVCWALAVVGREATMPVLARLTGAPRSQDPALLDALSELTRRQILDEPEPGQIRFVHDQIRAVAYASIPEAERRRLHRDAAQTLELFAARKGERDQALAPLAWHWQEAGEAARARDTYLAAARKAAQRAADREAERLYRSALGLEGSASAQGVLARYELAKHILELQGRHREALAEHLRLLADARALGHGPSESMALRGIGRVHWALGDANEARSFLDQALAVARQHGDRLGEGRALGNLGVLCSEKGALEEGRVLLEQALDLCVEAGDQQSVGITLDNLAGIHVEQGRSEQARALFDQALAVHRALGRRRYEAHTLGNLAMLARMEGRLEDARGLYEQALAIARELGHRRLEGVALAELGAVQAASGQIEAGRAYLRQGVSVLRDAGQQKYEARALLELAALERRTGGAPVEIEPLLARASSLASGEATESALCRCERGHLALAQRLPADEELAEARRTAERLKLGPSSEIGQAIARLERAVHAAATGQPMLRGESADDIPEGLRGWGGAAGPKPTPSRGRGERRERPRAT